MTLLYFGTPGVAYKSYYERLSPMTSAESSYGRGKTDLPPGVDLQRSTFLLQAPLEMGSLLCCHPVPEEELRRRLLPSGKKGISWALGSHLCKSGCKASWFKLCLGDIQAHTDQELPKCSFSTTSSEPWKDFSTDFQRTWFTPRPQVCCTVTPQPCWHGHNGPGDDFFASLYGLDLLGL